MVENKTAKKIGQRQAMKSALCGLLIAYTIMGGLIYSSDMKPIKALFWIFDVDFAFNLLVGAFGLLTMAYFFGRLAGVDILVKNKNEFVTGVKYGFLTLISATLIGSSIGFVQEGIDNIGIFGNPFYDYYFKPLYWVTMFGIIPVVVVGGWFGRQIKRKGAKCLAYHDASR